VNTTAAKFQKKAWEIQNLTVIRVTQKHHKITVISGSNIPDISTLLNGLLNSLVFGNHQKRTRSVDQGSHPIKKHPKKKLDGKKSRNQINHFMSPLNIVFFFSI
jgi:hypothetical protein